MLNRLLILSVLILAACDGQDPDTILQTAYELRGDEFIELSSVRISRAEQARQVAEALQADHDGLGSKSSALIVSGPCAKNTLWLYHGANYTGNQVCLGGTGSASLTSFGFGWLDGVDSYKSNTTKGSLSNGLDMGNTTGVFCPKANNPNSPGYFGTVVLTTSPWFCP